MAIKRLPADYDPRKAAPPKPPTADELVKIERERVRAEKRAQKLALQAERAAAREAAGKPPLKPSAPKLSKVPKVTVVKVVNRRGARRLPTSCDPQVEKQRTYKREYMRQYHASRRIDTAPPPPIPSKYVEPAEPRKTIKARGRTITHVEGKYRYDESGEDNAVGAVEVVAQLHPSLSKGNWYYISINTGIDRAHISRVLRGKKRASVDAVAAICRVAGVTFNEYSLHVAAVKAADPQWDSERAGFHERAKRAKARLAAAKRLKDTKRKLATEIRRKERIKARNKRLWLAEKEAKLKAKAEAKVSKEVRMREKLEKVKAAMGVVVKGDSSDVTSER